MHQGGGLRRPRELLGLVKTVRIVPQARKLAKVHFDEMLEMAGAGSKVLQIRSVEFAGKYQVPLRVLSSFTPWDIDINEEAKSGTLITFEEDENMEKAVVSGIAFSRDEAKISLMEDAVGTVCFATGMAAIVSTMTALLKRGDHVVASRFLFGNTASWFTTLTNLGCEVTLVDATAAGNVEQALRLLRERGLEVQAPDLRDIVGSQLAAGAADQQPHLRLERLRTP